MPPEIVRLAPVAGAIALGVLAYLLSTALSNTMRVRGARERVANFTGMQEASYREEVQVGSEEHKIRLACARFGLDVAGREMPVLWGIRLAGALILALLIWWIGFPLLAVPAGAVVGWMLAGGIVESAWNRMRRELEDEIPTFLSRLASTVQADPNVLQAVEEVGETLRGQGPLHVWIRRLVARVRAGGRPALLGMLAEAESISPSLGLAVFEVARLWETGGSGYVEAFAHAANNLGEILESRARAEAKAAGMKSAIRVVLGSLVLVVAVLLRNPTISASIRSPAVQVAYLAIALWVALGWKVVDGMIEEAVR
jgi:Flp pilus assembly protein TadB